MDQFLIKDKLDTLLSWQMTKVTCAQGNTTYSVFTQMFTNEHLLLKLLRNIWAVYNCFPLMEQYIVSAHMHRTTV